MGDKINEAITKVQSGIKKGVKKVGGTTINIINTQYKRHPLVVVLLLIILGIIILLFFAWAVGQIIGFFGTPLGIITLVLFMSAIGLYAYLRYLGIYLKGWLGATIEIALLFLFLIMFITISNAMVRAFMWIMPIAVVFGAIYFFAKVLNNIKDSLIRAFAIAMAITFIIVSVVANIFLVPYVWGTQEIIEIDISHVSGNAQGGIHNIVVNAEMYSPSLTMSMTTSMNPYIISLGEFGHNLWKFGEINIYIVDWELYERFSNSLIAESHNNRVYVVGDQTESVYGVVYLPTATKVMYEYDLYVTVYDEHYDILFQTTFVLAGSHLSQS